MEFPNFKSFAYGFTHNPFKRGFHDWDHKTAEVIGRIATCLTLCAVPIGKTLVKGTIRTCGGLVDRIRHRNIGDGQPIEVTPERAAKLMTGYIDKKRKEYAPATSPDGIWKELDSCSATEELKNLILNLTEKYFQVAIKKEGHQVKDVEKIFAEIVTTPPAWQSAWDMETAIEQFLQAYFEQDQERIPNFDLGRSVFWGQFSQHS